MKATHVRLKGYAGSYDSWVPTVCGLWDSPARLVENSPTCDYCRAVVAEKLNPVVPISAMPTDELPREHKYFSTACIHGEHGECRVRCKFCASMCRCDCHAPPGTFQGES